MIEKLYTIEEVAEILRRKPQTIHNYISSGKIGSIKGRPVLIPESALKEFLNRRRRRAII